MAHECPDCWQVCYCGSDIDDCLLNWEEDQMRCTHCADKPECDPDDDYLDDE